MVGNSSEHLRDFPSTDRKERMGRESHGLRLRPPDERTKDFEDVVLPLEPQQAIYEASRCIHCGDPAPCMKACPAKNDISQAIWLIEQGKFLEAAQVYRQTSSMPEICGRVCPHEQLCQGACVRGKKGQPVLTGALEAFAADYERQAQRQGIAPAPSTGRRVAVIGAGPAGLACAEQLLQRGHWVTIFETRTSPGGLLTYGIPNFKLPKSVVTAWWERLVQAGVTFCGGVTIGKTKTINQLFKEGFEAVFIGVGAGVDAQMSIPGENMPGVYQATDFLVRTNVPLELLEAHEKPIQDVGRRVVVIGGGDTASDCLRTSLRLGASEVTCLYRRTEAEMPGGYKDREMARQEGAIFQFLTQPVRFIPGPDGRLAGVECIRMELGEPDSKGRRRPVPVPDSNFTVQADTAVAAVGYYPDPTIGANTPGLKTHKWGLVVSDPETGATSRMGVYVGGDAVTGPDLVVTAMVAGRRAADTIDAYLY